MKVLKFGWTSVWSSEMIKKTAEIILNSKKDDNIVIVVSAMTKVTNMLIKICDLTVLWDIVWVFELFDTLKEKHINTLNEIDWDKNNEYYNKLETELNNLENILKWVTVLKSITDKTRAKILYYWEILSSIIVSSAITKLWIKSNNYLSKDLLICTWSYLNAECTFKKSEEIIDRWIKKINLDIEIPVVTWFWWGDESSDVCLFDRWGSDYVWSLMWRFLNADAIEIWTDVDGIMSADPRIVENPILWNELDYGVCAEFALVWAKVLHPKTISPAQEKFIPVYIKNTFKPTLEWTKICKKQDKWLKWINIDNEQVLLNFVDPTMIWWYWYVYQIVKILNDEKISLDALATTETSFSISIKSKVFNDTLKQKLLHFNEDFQVNIYENITKISFVWDSIGNYDILWSFEEEEIIMVTSWAYWKSLTVFVFNNNKEDLLRKLHKNVFWK